jgi:ABC-type polysaccharide/polyol phosphate transport system ATPase subunit
VLRIAFDDVSLYRRTQEEMAYDLKRLIFRAMTRQYVKPNRRKVLDKVTLRIESGEKVGILGTNGSGKSTLLKVICRILTPTSGRVFVHGKIAPLIELGAGFESDSSVVENIIYYGMLLGFSRNDMRRRTGSILDFAELHDHAGEPLKTLSSGMYARLGFAIATEVRPDILLLDEVLSVGDERFKIKCKERIQRFWDDHSTIIVVSHDLEFLASSCERVIWLDNGRIVATGDAETIVRSYYDSVHSIGRDKAAVAPKKIAASGATADSTAPAPASAAAVH